MPSIRIWTLESDNDAKAVRCLAKKLTTFMKLGQIPINTAGRRKPSINLEKAVQNYLKRDDCVMRDACEVSTQSQEVEHFFHDGTERLTASKRPTNSKGV